MNDAGWEKLKEQILIVLADYQTMSDDFVDKALKRQGTRNDIARRIIENGKLVDDTPRKLQHLLKELEARAEQMHEKGKQNGPPYQAACEAAARTFLTAYELVEELLRSEDLA